MARRFLLMLLVAFACGGLNDTVCAEDADQTALATEVAEFLQTHCLRCHKGERAKGKLDLTQFQTGQSMRSDPNRWNKIISRVSAGEMPPVGSDPPKQEERERFVLQARETLLSLCCEGGPRPGPAPLRRLNRTEYGATIRDLLRIEINLGQTLPDDGAGGEGFDNAAETLFLSPLHLEKYVEAAKEALDYAVKNPRSRAALLSGKGAEERRFGFGRRDMPPEPDPPATPETARAILDRFVPRAFRRPAREGEIEKYFALFEKKKKNDSRQV